MQIQDGQGYGNKSLTEPVYPTSHLYKHHQYIYTDISLEYRNTPAFPLYPQLYQILLSAYLPVPLSRHLPLQQVPMYLPSCSARCHIDDWWDKLVLLKTYFHSLDRPEFGLARWGITLIPPESLSGFQEIHNMLSKNSDAPP